MKKAPIAVALVLVFGLFTAAFSLAPAIAQNATSNATTSTNATGTTTTTTTNQTGTGNATTTNATEGSTFSASGSISTLIFDIGEAAPSPSPPTTTANETETSSATNETTMTTGNMTDSSNATTTTRTTAGNETATAQELEPPYVLSGNWSLDVQNGSVNDFTATFTMVHIDGTGRHTHDISNFQADNTTTVQLDESGPTFAFGTVDVAVNGTEQWTDVEALMILDRMNVMSISLATESTDNHFKGQPIFGIVDSMTDENGNEMIQTAQQISSAAGNATGGNMTQGAERTLNETSEFLGDVGERVQDLFNGTDSGQ